MARNKPRNKGRLCMSYEIMMIIKTDEAVNKYGFMKESLGAHKERKGNWYVSYDLSKPFYLLLLSSPPSIFFLDLHTWTHQWEKYLCVHVYPPSTLMQTKPVITMATDSKEAKLDERVEVTVYEGPGKQKQSEDLYEWPTLKVAVQHTKCTKDYQHCLFKNYLVFHGLQETSIVVCCLCALKMTNLSIFTHPCVFKNLYEGFIRKILFFSM